LNEALYENFETERVPSFEDSGAFESFKSERARELESYRVGELEIWTVGQLESWRVGQWESWVFREFGGLSVSRFRELGGEFRVSKVIGCSCWRYYAREIGLGRSEAAAGGHGDENLANSPSLWRRRSRYREDFVHGTTFEYGGGQSRDCRSSRWGPWRLLEGSCSLASWLAILNLTVNTLPADALRHSRVVAQRSWYSRLFPWSVTSA
jgi:hypothetical protein